MTTPNDDLPEPRSEAEIEAERADWTDFKARMGFWPRAQDPPNWDMKLVARRALDELANLQAIVNDSGWDSDPPLPGFPELVALCVSPKTDTNICAFTACGNQRFYFDAGHLGALAAELARERERAERWKKSATIIYEWSSANASPESEAAETYKEALDHDSR